MKVVIGLGNPGREYANNRHNVGFMVIDELVDRYGPKESQFDFDARIYKIELDGVEVLLAKPFTFMNSSGKSVKKIMAAFEVAGPDMLVVHDDMDIEKYVIKLKFGGGIAGHRGLESIWLETKRLDFCRLRFGIGRPPGKMDPSMYVLGDFPEEEMPELRAAISRACDAVESWALEGIDAAMNKFNAS